MDEVVKTPGRWSNAQKAGRGYLYHWVQPSKTDDCHRCFIQVNPQNFHQHNKVESSKSTSKWLLRNMKTSRNRRKKKEKDKEWIHRSTGIPFSSSSWTAHFKTILHLQVIIAAKHALWHPLRLFSEEDRLSSARHALMKLSDTLRKCKLKPRYLPSTPSCKFIFAKGVN